jgi:high-affinity iron transporter
MARNLFSVPIFFIVFRETLETAIIIATLLGLAHQIAHEGSVLVPASSVATQSSTSPSGVENVADAEMDNRAVSHKLARKLKKQIYFGTAVGFLIALSIGAAFIAVWFTKATDLMEKAELLWEGIFDLIACIMIFIMGISMLKLDRAKTKWRLKIQRAFEGKSVDGSARAGKWVLFFLPCITVMREGLEAVVFVGGVSLGQSATSIPIAAIVGLIVGLIVGFFIYQFASRATLSLFMIVVTNLLLLIGAGLFSKAAWSFERYRWERFLGINSDDSLGDGPGTFPVQGNVWHLDCCNPEAAFNGQGWSIFNAIFGWTNSATYGSVLSYVFYWLAVVVTLLYLKFKEGRMTVFGIESKAGARRRSRMEKSNEVLASDASP